MGIIRPTTRPATKKSVHGYKTANENSKLIMTGWWFERL